MGQVLQGSATTTEAVRRAIQHNQENLRILARRYGSQKTVAKYINATNADRKPFRWTKSADDIFASIQRFCLRTLKAHA
jgi:hypothetical protein